MIRSLSRFSRWGASGHCPAGGTASTERVSGIFLEETKCTRLAIVADLRRDHCIDGLILGGSKLPLTLQAGDARGCSVPGPDQGPRAPFRARTPALNRMPRSASHFGENDRPFGYRSKSLSISSYQLALS